MPRIHALKTWPEFYAKVVSGEKSFEIRRNDRGFSVGDVLVLAEWNPVLKAPTQEALAVRVTYMTDFAMPEGYVVMAIKPLVP